MNRSSRLLEYVLEWILMLLMVALTAIVVIAVVYRKFDASLSWYDEVASVALAWITYYGGALAVIKRKHIGFDSVLLAIPMPVRLYAALFAELVFLAFFVLLAWAGWEVLLSHAANLSLKLGLIDRYDSTPNGLERNDLNYTALLLWKL